MRKHIDRYASEKKSDFETGFASVLLRFFIVVFGCYIHLYNEFQFM